MMRKLYLTFLTLLTVWSVAGQTKNVYVSPKGDDANPGLSVSEPVATLAQAQRIVRGMIAKGLTAPVTVQVAGGIYPMTDALVFGPEDSGTADAPVTYRADGGAAILHGGQAVTGWKKHKDGIWVTTLPEVAAGKWDFRQLYVNGALRRRARTPNEGWMHVKSQPGVTDTTKYYPYSSDVFEYYPGDIDPKWKNLDDAEVILYHYWIDVHLPIQSVDAKNNLVTFRYPTRRVFRDGFEGNMARYIVENLYEALDQPGEWVLNRKTGQLFYMPMPGENMATAEVIAPRTGEFIRLQGDPENGKLVENIRFEGLTFMYSNFVLPEGDANDYQAARTVTACINIDGARYCVFERCTFRHLGTFAFELFSGCTYNTFRHNTIEHVAAGGFHIQGVEPGGKPALRTGNNVFSDNEIGHYGQTYAAAVAILMRHSDNNEISHNHIHHGNYTGISVGWSWNYLRSASRGNIIEKNHIHDIGMQNLLSDMGGIYTLGLSPGTVIRGNLLHDVNANQYGGWGIYMDEGTTSVLIEDNIVYNTKFGMFNIHYSKDLMVRNNIFALGKLENISRERVEPHVSAYFEGNIVYWKTGELLARDWADSLHQLYVGYFKGWVDTTATIVSDWNLFYNPGLTVDQVDFNGHTWEEWHKMGRDKHSLYADPLFVDPENFDFRLRPGSPAFKLGFRPIDLSDVGPRRL